MSSNNTPVKSDNQSLANYYGYSKEQFEAIKNTVAKGATADELVIFFNVAKHYGLDPFLKEIICIVSEYGGKRSFTMAVPRDGYLGYAQRQSTFKGVKSASVKQNDDFELDVFNGTVKHKIKAGDRGKLVGAWALVEIEGRNPILYYANLEDYLPVQTFYKDNNPKSRGAWDTHPAAMIEKVAQARALKFAMGMSGITSQEEMAAIRPEVQDVNFEIVEPDKLQGPPPPVQTVSVETPTLPPPPAVTPEKLAEMLAKARELAHSPEWTAREREIRVKYIEDNFNKYDLLRVSVTKMEDQLAEKRAAEESAKDLPADFQEAVKEGNQAVRKSREEFSALTGEIVNIIHNAPMTDEEREYKFLKFQKMASDFDKLTEFLNELRADFPDFEKEVETDALPV